MKKIIALLAGVILAFTLMACQTDTTTVTVTVDTTTFNDIYTVVDLQNMEMNKSYILQADLDLSTLEWVPLGSYENPFAGIFDGNGHTISNLTITAKKDFAGLFAAFSGEAYDLTLSAISIDYTTDYQTYVGGLAGYISGSVENITVSGAISVVNSESDTFAGLLAGKVVTSIGDSVQAADFTPETIDNIHVSGTIYVNTDGFLYAGGLAGYVFNVRMDNNYSDTQMTLVADNYRLYAGGLIGYHYGGILYEYSTQVSDIYIPITGSVAAGSITLLAGDKAGYVGGFVGYGQGGYYEDDLAYVDISAGGSTVYVSALAGGIWDVIMTDVLGSGTISVTASDDQEKTVGTLSASETGDNTFTGCYYLVTTGETLSFSQGTLTENANLTDPDWYPTWLDWDEGVCTYIELAAFPLD